MNMPNEWMGGMLDPDLPGASARVPVSLETNITVAQQHLFKDTEKGIRVVTCQSLCTKPRGPSGNSLGRW